MATVYTTTFQLRRGNASVWEKNNPVLSRGEPGFEIDTNRLKIGDGSTAWNDLCYVGDSIQKGYFHEGAFYSDSTLSVEMNPSTIKVYIDLKNGQMYHYTGTNYQKIEGNLPVASDINPGIFKVYSTTGDNEDGTMTQKAITAALNRKVEVDVDDTGEILIFK